MLSIKKEVTMKVFKGIINAIVLSIPFWAIILYIIWRW